MTCVVVARDVRERRALSERVEVPHIDVGRADLAIRGQPAPHERKGRSAEPHPQSTFPSLRPLTFAGARLPHDGAGVVRARGGTSGAAGPGGGGPAAPGDAVRGESGATG